ncbi:MAG TPA: putative Ig domain-containing protein, partial [Blastocatellia bacterium]
GAWSIVSGAGGTVTTPSSPTSTFTGVAGPSYTLRWTISNSPCTDSTDDVVINLTANPTTANAGPDQAFCGTPAAALAANTPGVGTGAWTVVTGPSTLASQFSSTSSPSATFTPAGGTGVYTLRWTISNAPCTDSTDDVVLTYNAVPTITPGASPSVFPGTTSANLPYTATTGSPDQYSIDYNAAANSAGFVDVTNAALPASPIVLVVPGVAASATYNATLTVRNSATGCVSGAVAFTVTVATCPTITVSPSDSVLQAGRSGTPYNQTFTQTGGAGIVVFSVSTGELPAGLTLSPGGVLSGTPAVFGSFGFIVRATDANNCFGERAYTLVINPPCTTITISPASVPAGFQGTAYSQTLTATGGGAPYSFTLTAGALPSGLSLSSSGALTGTPSVSGNFNFTVTATDNTGCTGTGSYTLLVSGDGLQFYPLAAPVRLLDTRAIATTGCVKNTGPFANNETRTQAARTACSTIPAAATAVVGNITVVPSGPGFLTLFPSDAAQPPVANSNFKAGEVTNNFFTVALGTTGVEAGAFKIFTGLFTGGTNTEVIIDVTGYYAPPAAAGLYYHPLPTPVRLLQTFPGQTGCILNGSQQLQGANDPNANPALDLLVQGRSPGLLSPCNGIPNDAVVLVGNATTVFPQAPLGSGYLTIYPSDAARPTVASSNYGNNDIVNGPFAVKLGADGAFKVYTFSTTHLVIDISGYYSASPSDANGAGLLFNPLLKPMRLLETRADFPGFPLTGCYRPNAPIAGGTGGIRTQQVWGTCSDQPITIPNVARAVAGNVTVINPVGAGFGTFFPGDVGTAPTVATTNYPFPVVFGYNRHYFAGLSPTDGTFKILTQFTSDYIVDVSGYFAP